MVSDPKKLPILLAIPAVIFLVVGLLLKMVGIDWLNFAPSGDHLWQADYIGNYLVDIIMIPTFFGAVACLCPGAQAVSGRHARQRPGRGQDRQG
jgi:quinone-modifying oxidoreductase subunit QmoC